jgi:ectoine hydroxylase-related dioxygenase (phytanoyl-CoA dioxygenase family)
MPNIDEQLDEYYELSRRQVDDYQENGFIKLKQVFAPKLLDHFRGEIAQRVHELNTQHLPMDKRSAYDKAFLQIMNLWTVSDLVRKFVFGKRLARIATDLMGCRGVRIYHDQALYKEPHGGITPWHADQYYWPVSNDNMTTAWIPLQTTPLSMGPLAFCEKSHRFQRGRDLEIGEESEMTLKQALSSFPLRESPFAMGDVSFHAGWTFHRAGENTTDNPREVMTIIFMDEDMRLAKPKNKNQVVDVERWCPGVQEGGVVASNLNPVIYSKEG